MRRSLVVGILLGTLLAASAAAQKVQVTLQEAIQRALQIQPAMVQARGDQSNASAQRLAAVGAFIPAVTVNSSAFRQSQASIVNGLPAQAGTYQYNTGLTLNVDLFDGLRRIQQNRKWFAPGNSCRSLWTNCTPAPLRAPTRCDRRSIMATPALRCSRRRPILPLRRRISVVK